MQIIIISGQERCGKSALAKFIKESNKNKNVRVLYREEMYFHTHLENNYCTLLERKREGIIIILTNKHKKLLYQLKLRYEADFTVINIPTGAYVGYKNTLPKQMSYAETT